MDKKIYLLIISVVFFCLACNQPPQTVKDIELSDLDTTVHPGTDFDAYANGGWKRNNPLPGEESRYGTFDKLDDMAREQVRTLFAEIAESNHTEGSIEKKIADFYSSGMDSAAIEAAGYAPLKKFLAQADSIATINDLQQVMAQWHRMTINPLFFMYADADQKNSTKVVAYINQGGLGMPDRDYYLNQDERSLGIQQKYREFIAGVFQLTGQSASQATQQADIVYEIEKEMAAYSMSLLDQRDPYKTYHKMTVSDLQKIAPDFDWAAYFRATGVNNPGEFIVSQPDYFAGISKMLRTVPAESWKLYLKWRLMSGLSDCLSHDFADLHFNFYGKTLGGRLVERPRWKRVQDVTDGALSEAVGQMYVERYFPPQAKQRMTDLVENLRISLGERIMQLDWMSGETKQKAMEKLKAITVKVGYPDKWRDYSRLQVTPDSYVGNVLSAGRFDFDRMTEKINRPVDRAEWHMPPQMVNAYYNPTSNEIVFPAAILQPPFFYMSSDDAVNYGAIGVVIGHEMTHGFDDQGRQYDRNGNLNDWWTEKDAKLFNERASVLVEQYNQYTVLDTVKADGKLTLGENIADLGGLNIAFQALQKAKTGDEKPIDGFTPEQRFFLAYAHLWAQNIRDEEIMRRTKTDVHSLGRYRVNGPLRNMPEFYAAFQTKQGDPMHLAKDQRAVIW
ncbi:MAG: M13 family metallopeptidase [Prolixibacteraceae bacterium]